MLPNEVLEHLALRQGDIVVDATIGLAGHATLMLDKIGPDGHLIGLDVDDENLALAKSRLADAKNVTLIRANFSEIVDVVRDAGMGPVRGVLADLGISSRQLENPQRGFSFSNDGPLDMRLDQRLEHTAADLVNRLSETELADVIYHNSQERGSRRIARAIHRARHDGRITTTGQLAEIVCQALRQNPAHHRQKIHPATRTFMALRIAVNQELDQLGKLLASIPEVLCAGGRAAMISFHSLEDGHCKRAFREMKTAGLVRWINKKPILASATERDANPRARSAKLRVVERTEQPMP